jgi:hypothetical protein
VASGVVAVLIEDAVLRLTTCGLISASRGHSARAGLRDESKVSYTKKR